VNTGAIVDAIVPDLLFLPAGGSRNFLRQAFPPIASRRAVGGFFYRDSVRSTTARSSTL
jgi:hypothetical protein